MGGIKESKLKSLVSFDFTSGISIREPLIYPSINASPQMDGDLWKGLSIEINHPEDASPSEIVDDARNILRDVFTLIGVGRGLEEPLQIVRVRSVSAGETGPTTGQVSVRADALVVRSLRAMPSENLLMRLRADPKLRRQAEALNAARAASDVISRIRWSYMVLEQEELRNSGYVPLDDYRHLRNGASHPELTKPAGKAYFQKVLGVDFPDLKNPDHFKFVAAQSTKLLEEAVRIVEESFRGDEFW